MSLNKGSLDKANQEQKLDIEYLYRYFTAGENIAINEVVAIDAAGSDQVKVATVALRGEVVGVAVETKLSGQQIKICIYGVATVIAGSNVSAGDIVTVYSTDGTVTASPSIASGGGSAHTHAETLGMGVPSGTLSNVPHNCGISFLYAASSSGGACTTSFYALDAAALVSAADSTHNHTISGAITAESAHTHGNYPMRILGKMLEDVSAGNTGKCFFCLP